MTATHSKYLAKDPRVGLGCPLPERRCGETFLWHARWLGLPATRGGSRRHDPPAGDRPPPPSYSTSSTILTLPTSPAGTGWCSCLLRTLAGRYHRGASAFSRQPFRQISGTSTTRRSTARLALIICAKPGTVHSQRRSGTRTRRSGRWSAHCARTLPSSLR